MFKKYSLVLAACFCFVLSGFGQILTFEFSALTGDEISATSNFNNTNLNNSTIIRGSGLNAAVNTGRFNATEWALTSIVNAVSGNNYMEFTIKPTATYQFSVASIVINLQRSTTGPSEVALRSSMDSYSSDLDAVKTIANNKNTQTFTFIFTQANSTSAVTYRFYMYAQATSGSGGIGDGTGNDIIVNGTVTSTGPTITVTQAAGGAISPGTASYTTGSNQNFTVAPTACYTFTNWVVDGASAGNSVPYSFTGINADHTITAVFTEKTIDFANIQFPTTTQTIVDNGPLDVYAQVYEPGVTEAAGAGAGMSGWIGYSTINNAPTNASWTWKPATFNVQAGNNDEFTAEIGSALAPGTYYYASRFRIGSCAYKYGGAGGNWNNDSVKLIVQPDQVNFCNLQSPATGNISISKPFLVFARAQEPGVTEAAGADSRIKAWIGYNATNTDPSTWPAANWVLATYQGQFGNDDEYVGDLGPKLNTEGTYYYASRFQLNGSSYSYGGITPPNGGSFWDGITYISGIVNVTKPPNSPTGFIACMEDTKANLSWNAPLIGTTPDGYVVFAIEGGTNITGPKVDAILYTANSNFAAAPTETPITLGKVVYKGTATNAVITGLTEDANYSFTVFAYKNESSTGWSITSTGSRQTNVLAQDDVRNLAANPATNKVDLMWNNPLPTNCFDELIIVANQGTVIFNPTGTYAPITGNYTTPNTVVYATTGTPPSSKAISGLTNDLNYCFKIYIRRGSVWSDGAEICATPTLTYCIADGGTNSSGILNVNLNTINNSSVSTEAYSDFTSISTDVVLGTPYNLSVNVNTGGNHISKVKVWIDWNQDGLFNNGGTSNEMYELGSVDNSVDGQPDLSPITVIVPSNAMIGNTHMRVSAKSDDGEPYATPCEDFSFGEVEDYTINILQPTDAEINVKGAGITIPNGFSSPYGLNNTLFAGTNIGASAGAKTFTIENIGLTTLNLTGTPIVQLTGDHPGDFIVTQQPASSSIASNGSLPFKINFIPTAEGERTAIVSIQNSDVTGVENPYTFKIKGTGLCTATIVSTILPNSGPVGTEVTITSPSNLTGATAILNGMPMAIISSTATELVVQVPAGATTGPLKLYLSTGCSSTNPYTVINNAINGCQASSSSTIPSNLFISEVTDATSGSSSYVEIFNGTSSAINLNTYSIKIFNNGSADVSSTSALIGTIASGASHVITIGTTTCTPTNLGAGVVKQTFNSAGGINFKTDSSDLIALYKNSTLIDILGVPGSDSWANGLGIGKEGVDFQRKNTATPLPSTTFNINDWDVTDWTDCGDSDYGNLGAYDFSIGVPPSVTLQPIAPISTCDLSAVLTIAGMEGYNPPSGDTAELAYQWYYNATGTNDWTEILSTNTLYSGQQSEILTIPNTLNLDNYQYYCQVRESGLTCFKASNAIKLHVFKSEWNGTAWAPSTPTINSIAIINGDYDMTVTGDNRPSFSACQLLINSGFALTVENNKFVEIQNNVINNGNIYVAKQGSFVQIADTGTITLNSATAKNTVSKYTTPLLNWYDYTYWSSPLANAQIEVALSSAKPSRRFVYNASAFVDIWAEDGNTGTFIPGSDDIDDFGNDWVVQQTGTMVKGIGYAATHNNIGFMAPNTGFQYIFEGTQSNGGAFNTGNVAVDIYINPSVTYNNWNLIGNPYPSAINALTFFQQNNSIIEGVIYLWSHKSLPSNSNSGNQNQNFSQDDYAMINYTGGTAVQGISSVSGSAIPNGYIASGQGFFVIGKKSGATSGAGNYNSTVFTNAMRSKIKNDQFFRTSNVVEPDKLWVNLTSDSGIFSQVLIGYMEGASNNFDGMQFDAYRNLSTANSAILYTTIADSENKFAIQARNPQSLTLEESIPLGFETLVTQPTNYSFSIEQLQGEFLTTNSIYIKDNLLNLTHNLSASDYVFSSETGEFNTRFEIVFREQTLSVIENEIPASGLSIIELTDGRVKFSVGNSLTIKSVEILDMLGRTLYNLKGTSPSEVYELSNLSQAAYIAKVTLSNGQLITKRAVKQK